jgi:type III pantothenate kinase
MLLVADIGNSATLVGLRSDDGSIAHRWRLHTDASRSPDELGVLLRSLLATAADSANAIEACCFASVVPPQTIAFGEAVERHIDVPARELRWGPELGVPLEVDEPQQVGPDRIANTLAAHLGYPGPVIVVDLGTATNFDVVSADGAFLGGVIAPGVETGAATLTARTALLPRVAVAFPASLIGKTTVANIQIGVYHGATAMIDGLVDRIRAEWEPLARVIATGGFALPIASRCRTVDVVDPDLTLKGVGWAHDRLHPHVV